MKYIILTATTTEKLQTKVNVAINNGYTPIGGVTDGKYEYIQALIKEKQ